MAEVTMKYLGSNLQLTNDMFPANKLTEIQVIQQHCGASTVCVFREMIPPNSKLFCINQFAQKYFKQTNTQNLLFIQYTLYYILNHG